MAIPSTPVLCDTTFVKQPHNQAIDRDGGAAIHNTTHDVNICANCTCVPSHVSDVKY